MGDGDRTTNQQSVGKFGLKKFGIGQTNPKKNLVSLVSPSVHLDDGSVAAGNVAPTTVSFGKQNYHRYIHIPSMDMIYIYICVCVRVCVYLFIFLFIYLFILYMYTHMSYVICHMYMYMYMYMYMMCVYVYANIFYVFSISYLFLKKN